MEQPLASERHTAGVPLQIALRLLPIERVAELLEGLIRRGDFAQGQALMAGVAVDGARTVSELQSTYILENG